LLRILTLIGSDRGGVSLFSGGGDGSARIRRFCGLGVAVVSFFAGLAVCPLVLVLQWWAEIVVMWPDVVRV
jgi:hypothetical protein